MPGNASSGRRDITGRRRATSKSGRCAWPGARLRDGELQERLFRQGTRRIRFRPRGYGLSCDGRRLLKSLVFQGFRSLRRTVCLGAVRAWHDAVMVLLAFKRRSIHDAGEQRTIHRRHVLPLARRPCPAIPKRIGSANCASNMLVKPLAYPGSDAASRGHQAVVQSGP
jgi:hypothetical protein